MGINIVNSDIMETLRKPKNDEDFWWLNNGITILCSSATSIGKSITIENVQIVNGLQTSECIYRFFTEQNSSLDNRLVLIKILPCENTEIADEIIRSTNNQTSVMSSSLRATDKIQEDIEDILKQKDLYYDRRINFYHNMGYPTERIISPLYLAKGYMALILKRPYNAVKLKQRFMRKQRSYGEVFNENDDIRIWPQIANIMRDTDAYMTQLRDRDCGERFLHNVRYQVAFLTVSRLLGSFVYNQNDIINFDIATYTKDEVNRTWLDILSVRKVDGACKSWGSMFVSLDISRAVSDIEIIDKYEAIDKIKRKKFQNIVSSDDCNLQES